MATRRKFEGFSFSSQNIIFNKYYQTSGLESGKDSNN